MAKRILAVDPDVVDRLIVKRLLSDDFHVVTLSSAREALAYARSNPFDVVIINHKLINHYDGVVLLHNLKQLNKTFFSIATTAMCDEVSDLALTVSGFAEVAEKPLTSVKIKEIIRRGAVI